MACGSLCFRGSFLPLPSTPSPSSSSSSSTSTRRAVARGARVRAAALPPMPPLDPRDPFLSKLASVAASNPETLSTSTHGNIPPYLGDFLNYNPTLRTSPPAQVESYYSGNNEHRTRKPPPDLPSLLLHGRIVYIGTPLVSAVTELVIGQLLYLQYDDPKKPIYMYINSTGTTQEDDEPVALETEGFAIYDAMRLVKNDIETVALGVASGQACLLLAAGKKGRRFILPNTKAMLLEPSSPPTGQMSASRLAIRAKEIIHYRDTLAELFARHTGNSVETVLDVMGGGLYMDAKKAKEFGIIDKVLFRGKQKMMDDVASPEEWDRRAGVKTVDWM